MGGTVKRHWPDITRYNVHEFDRIVIAADSKTTTDHHHHGGIVINAPPPQMRDIFFNVYDTK